MQAWLRDGLTQHWHRLHGYSPSDVSDFPCAEFELVSVEEHEVCYIGTDADGTEVVVGPAEVYALLADTIEHGRVGPIFTFPADEVEVLGVQVSPAWYACVEPGTVLLGLLARV